jgi:hypothetical protein
MHSLELPAAVADFVEAAAGQLQAEVLAGAEVAFELEGQRAGRRAGAGRAGGSVLYAYRALTDRFIGERWATLAQLPSYGELARLLEGFGGLERYLASVGADPSRGDLRARVRTAITALLCDVFEEQSDFQLHPERLRSALERLERSALADGRETTIVATLHGVAISSTELALTKSLVIVQPHALEGLPEEALTAGSTGDHDHLIVALAAGEDEPSQAIARGCEALKELLRALRLFGDGRVTLGTLAWTRVAGGRWRTLALGAGGRPHGMLVVTAEQEDELRAFCNLVSRRAPHGNELAWALRRFELGCERESPLEGLTDHLLALRALLEPEGPASGLLAGRVAALCATPEHRMALTERTLAALALERDVITGATAHPERRPDAGRPAGQLEHPEGHRLARDMADHLRALLRDVICGHLGADLVGFADEILLASAQPSDHDAQASDHRARAPEHDAQPAPSLEQTLGDPVQASEILDIFI